MLHFRFFLRGPTLSLDQLTLSKQKKPHETGIFNILSFISYSIFPYASTSRCAGFFVWLGFCQSLFIIVLLKPSNIFFYFSMSLQNAIYMIMVHSMTSKLLVFMKFEIAPSNPPLFYCRNIIQVSARSTGI